MPGPAVQLSDVSKTYHEGDSERIVLRDVSVTIAPGEIAVLVGRSGSGKSTLLNLIAGIDRPTAGRVRVDGIDLTALDEDARTRFRRSRIGFVFQFFNLVPVLNAEENMLLPLSIAGRKPERVWVEQLMRTVGIDDRRTHRPSELSGGQQQRVAVARALVSRPAVIFADEPTGNLDSATSTEVLQLLRRAVDEFGESVVMVTHDEHAASFADRRIELVDGLVVRDEAT